MRLFGLIISAMALAMGASSAFALDANEIANRLKAQAGAAIQGGGKTRGVVLSYGDESETPPTTAKPSVVSVPTTAAAQPTPSTLAPSSKPAAVLAAPAPVYTIQEQAVPTTTVTLAEPSVTVPAAPAPVYTIQEQAVPTTTVTLVEPSTTIGSVPTVSVIESPVVTEAKSQPSPDPKTYTRVVEKQRIDLRIFFEWNSAALKSEAIGQLAELCTAIRLVGVSPGNRYKIIGHTDKSGSDQYNLYLSSARANEVKRHLVEECALPPAALIAVGEGERQSRPDTPSNAPEERRVEIQFVS